MMDRHLVWLEGMSGNDVVVDFDRVVYFETLDEGTEPGTRIAFSGGVAPVVVRESVKTLWDFFRQLEGEE